MFRTFKAAILLALSGMIPGGLAHAANNVSLSSEVFVERKVSKPDGRTAIVLESPSKVIPGDDLVFVLKYKNVGSQEATNFSVTNPIPAAISFSGTADGKEIVSVDGGQNWGALQELQIKQKDGSTRAAQMSDVTHIKWKFNQSISAGS